MKYVECNCSGCKDAKKRKVEVVEVFARPHQINKNCLGCGCELERNDLFCSADCRSGHYENIEQRMSYATSN